MCCDDDVCVVDVVVVVMCVDVVVVMMGCVDCDVLDDV